ncbi:MAG: cyclic nucleotide-binding domain-containing protein [Syntrophobacteraceae bacterium]
MESLLQQEELVDHYVSQNNREAAVKLLFDLIVHYAKERRDFSKAEALRQKLFEVDGMALTEIIKSAEIIETAKSESFDRDHFNIWTGLYSTLTAEESNILYSATREAQYDPDHSVFKQGEMNPCLYFIDQGHMKLTYSQGNSEIFLYGVKEGDIVGQDTFFSNTVCNVSLTTVSPVKLRSLHNGILSTWRKDYPLLESRLTDYCLKFQKVDDLLKKRNLDRRSLNRFKVSGKALFQIIDATGTPVGNAFKGGLSDISSGGLSFFIRISKEETARLLLGRKLHIRFALSLDEAKLQVDKNGKIVAVRAHPFEDHSVHVKFDGLLDQNLMEEIERCPNSITPV